MAYTINPAGVGCTNVNTLEKMKFVECPDGSGEVAVRVAICNQDEKIDVNVDISPELPSNFEPFDLYGGIEDLAIGVFTDVVTYTVPAGQMLVLDKIEASGDNVSKFRVTVDSVIHGVRRLDYTTHNTDFPYKSFEVNAGEEIKLEVINCGTQEGDFDGRIIGALKTL